MQFSLLRFPFFFFCEQLRKEEKNRMPNRMHWNNDDDIDGTEPKKKRTENGKEEEKEVGEEEQRMCEN